MVENFADADQTETEQTRRPTRRQALSAIGTVTGGGLILPGVLADDSDEFSSKVTDQEPEWWVEDDDSIGTYDEDDEDVILVEDGVTDWISEDNQTPEWFTIHEEDEVRYKPHGAFRTQDAELCLPTSVDVGPVTVGIEACHYGGCEWEVNACLVACVGTGRNDDCSSEYEISGDIGVVNAELVADPRSDSGWGVDRIHVSGELCYYYFLGSDCSNVNHTFEF